jgi:hypothetical protein
MRTLTEILVLETSDMFNRPICANIRLAGLVSGSGYTLRKRRKCRPRESLEQMFYVADPDAESNIPST